MHFIHAVVLKARSMKHVHCVHCALVWDSSGDDDYDGNNDANDDHYSGTTIGVSAHGGKVYRWRPWKFFFQSFKKLMTFFSRQPLRITICHPPFRNYLQNYQWNLILRSLCGPFDPQIYIKIYTGKLILHPPFTCAPGSCRPPLLPLVTPLDDYYEDHDHNGGGGGFLSMWLDDGKQCLFMCHYGSRF